jgi:hypothetical protein
MHFAHIKPLLACLRTRFTLSFQSVFFQLCMDEVLNVIDVWCSYRCDSILRGGAEDSLFAQYATSRNALRPKTCICGPRLALIASEA